MYQQCQALLGLVLAIFCAGYWTNGIADELDWDDIQRTHVHSYCGDWLQIYAQKPQNLEYIGCSEYDNGKHVAAAEYRIEGTKSQKIGDFLVNNYGMENLSVYPNGWETGGGDGVLMHPDFQSIHPNLKVYIDMYGPGEERQVIQGGVLYELDRNKIPYFYVVVNVYILEFLPTFKPTTPNISKPTN